MPADNHQVALGVFEPGEAGQAAPALEPRLFEQRHARFVMPENVAEQGPRFQSRRVGDRFFEQSPPNPATVKFFANVNADLSRAAIGGPADELVETEPARDLSIDLRDPERKLVRRMPAEPGKPLLDRDRLE